MRLQNRLVVLSFAALLGGSAVAADFSGFGGASFSVPVTSIKEARYKTTHAPAIRLQLRLGGPRHAC
jgi:hypothetical protein